MNHVNADLFNYNLDYGWSRLGAAAKKATSLPRICFSSSSGKRGDEHLRMGVMCDVPPASSAIALDTRINKLNGSVFSFSYMTSTNVNVNFGKVISGSMYLIVYIIREIQLILIVFLFERISRFCKMSLEETNFVQSKVISRIFFRKLNFGGSYFRGFDRIKNLREFISRK